MVSIESVYIDEDQKQEKDTDIQIEQPVKNTRWMKKNDHVRTSTNFKADLGIVKEKITEIKRETAQQCIV